VCALCLLMCFDVVCALCVARVLLCASDNETPAGPPERDKDFHMEEEEADKEQAEEKGVQGDEDGEVNEEEQDDRNSTPDSLLKEAETSDPDEQARKNEEEETGKLEKVGAGEKEDRKEANKDEAQQPREESAAHAHVGGDKVADNQADKEAAATGTAASKYSIYLLY
jgi:hypothetical protein